MKIALCLFGYVGSTSTKTNACALTDNFEYIKNNILKTSSNIDVFIHSWQKEEENKISNLLQPKYYIFETQKKFQKLYKF